MNKAQNLWPLVASAAIIWFPQKETTMFKLDKFRTKVLDSNNRVVGCIKNGFFTQDCQIDKAYIIGLTAIDLEQISEAMQRSLSRSEA
jgi:hypothetical protein